MLLKLPCRLGLILVDQMRDLPNEFYVFLRRKLVPELRYSQLIFEEELANYVEAEMNWLDVGCGHQLLPAWRLDEERALVGQAKMIVGIDPDLASLKRHVSISRRIVGSASALPFDDGCFDLVTANMVVEHLDNPVRQFSEIIRVLRPGGRFVFHTVNRSGYFARMRKLVPDRLAKTMAALLDGRSAEDVYGVHYLANDEPELTRLSKQIGSEIEAIEFISSDAVFAVVPPLAAVELVWIKLLMRPWLKRLRTNLIVVMRKR